MIELIQFPWSPVLHRATPHSGIFRREIQNHQHPQRRPLARLEIDAGKILRRARHPRRRKNCFRRHRRPADHRQISRSKTTSSACFPPSTKACNPSSGATSKPKSKASTFRLNDIYWREIVKPADQLLFLRHKERKFGRGCIDQWRATRKTWLKKLETGLCRSNRCWRIRNFSSANVRCSWTSTCSGCWKIFSSPAITRCRNRSRICAHWHRRMKNVRVPR